MDVSPRKSTIMTHIHSDVLWAQSSSYRSGRSPAALLIRTCPRKQRLVRFAPQSRQLVSFCCRTRRDFRENVSFAPRIELSSAHPAITPIATPGRAMFSNRPLPKYPNAKLKNPRARRGFPSAGANPWRNTTHGKHAQSVRSSAGEPSSDRRNFESSARHLGLGEKYRDRRGR